MLAYISACRGVIGFKVGTWLCPVREKVRPAALFQRESAKKFAPHAQNGRKTLFSGALGELFRGNAAGGAALGELFRGNAAGSPAPGELCRACWRSDSCEVLALPSMPAMVGVSRYTSSVPHSGVIVGGRPVACYGCGHCINYMPKGSGRWALSDANLDVIADNRGECPGKTLNWDTPKQCLELLLRT